MKFEKMFSTISFARKTIRKSTHLTYPISRVTEHPDKNRCLKSHVGNRMSVSCVKRAQPLTSNNFNFVLVFKMRCKNSSFIRRDSSCSDATDSSSNSGKPGESIYGTEFNFSNLKSFPKWHNVDLFALTNLLVLGVMPCLM